MFRRSAHLDLSIVSFLSLLLGVLGGFIAPALTGLIQLVTNLSFHGRLSTAPASPADNHLGLVVVAIPALGGLVVGLMARFGSKAIRGHGIPEAMEQVLENDSRIPARITFLKPLSAAISIGTGGPFGAEGPIIATGGAFGSLLGQVISTTAAQRKTLLAAGAAAGMAGIFGSPVSAVLLAIELLLFEFRSRSFVPVAIAAAMAAGIRVHFEGAGAIFPMPAVAPVTLPALGAYTALGILVGVLAVGVSRSVYWVEDQFEKLPIHWMWWPAIGGLAVGAIGCVAPRTLGVGYSNISAMLGGAFPLKVVAMLACMKFLSWSISLGSGTSGGTLAPLLTIGSGAGTLAAAGMARLFPAAGLDLRVGALVGMAAMFAGASRALLTSIVFAFETTLQPNGLLPVMAGSSLAYLAARLLAQHSIMTEKIARRGLRIPQDYDPDAFAHCSVREIMETKVATLPAESSLAALADRIAQHDPAISAYQAWPLVDTANRLRGIITRGDLLRALQADGGRDLTLLKAGAQALVVTHPDETVHNAVALMIEHGVGRLPVVEKENPASLIGYLSRTHLLSIRLRKQRHENDLQPGWLRNGSPARGGQGTTGAPSGRRAPRRA